MSALDALPPEMRADRIARTVLDFYSVHASVVAGKSALGRWARHTIRWLCVRRGGLKARRVAALLGVSDSSVRGSIGAVDYWVGKDARARADIAVLVALVDGTYPSRPPPPRPEFPGASAPRRTVRRPDRKAPTADRKRPCLRCCRPFNSTGAHNRLCAGCNNFAATLDPRMTAAEHSYGAAPRGRSAGPDA